MSNTFANTMRSLYADRYRGAAMGAIAVIMLLGAWAGWFVWGRVWVYATSTSARLETMLPVHPIHASVSGRIADIHLALQSRVSAGKLLVQLDDAIPRLLLNEEKERLSGFEQQIDSVRDEINADERAMAASARAAEVALAQQKVEHQRATAAHEFNVSKVEQLRQLYKLSNASQLELTGAELEARESAAALEAARLGIDRITQDHVAQENDRAARIEARRAELTRLTAALATSRATVQRLQGEIERYRICAPIDGEVAEIRVLSAGQVVEPGQQLGAIVPDGRLRLVAQFAPASAMGRIRVGQAATVRFDGFPWAQFGRMDAKVVRMASEPFEDSVRVELEIADGRPAIPLCHGLPGVVEVQVEQASPVALVLRAAGKWVSTEAAIEPKHAASTPGDAS
jgi:membrane fusion protein (multidrug efflux system)